MSEEERKDIASCISSILISTTRRMTIKQLDNDFTNTIGYRIPYQKFGCSSLEQFLRTLHDKVQVQGYGSYAEVAVVITQKTAHINDLIAKQRTKIPRYTSRRKFSYYSNINPEPIPKSRPRNNEQPSQNVKYTEPARKTEKYTEPARKTEKYTEAASKTEKYTEPASKTEKTVSTGATRKKNEEVISEPGDVYFSEDETESNTKVPPIIQDNLRILISKHPDGIWSSSLLQIYKKEYGKFFSFTEFGYRSIAEMCVDLRRIFTVVQLDNNDVKLFDKHKPIPKGTLNTIINLQLTKMKEATISPVIDAIPRSNVEELVADIYNEKVPPDAVQFGTILEHQWLDPGTNEQDYIDINVGEVYDPSKFWINLKSYAYQLNKLMDDLQIFYGANKFDFLVPYFALKIGLYVACIFDNEYHRAKIIDTSQKNERVIKVYFVDYGTVSVIFIDSVCYLHKKFADLPEQGIRARLAGIYPPTENEQWSKVAASQFLDLVKQRDLVALLININNEKKIIDIVLADTSEPDEDFFINDALVHMGHAIFTFQSQMKTEVKDIVPIVRYIHLFPTFEELENGLVPTAVQMINMHYAGMTIQQIYPHYFKDSNSNLPVSAEQTPDCSSTNVDYAMEEPYYDHCDEIDDVADADEYYQENTNNTNVSAIDTASWSEILEQNTVDEEESIEKRMHNISIQTNSEEEVDDLKDDKPRKSNISVQTNLDIELAIEATQIEQTKDYLHETNDKETTNNSTPAHTNQPSNLTPTFNIHEPSDLSDTIKKPSRPPPGYGPHPQNLTYNNTGPRAYVTPGNYINPSVGANAYYPLILQQTQYLNALALRNQYLQHFPAGINTNPHVAYGHYGMPINYQYTPYRPNVANPQTSYYNQNTHPMPPYNNAVYNTTTFQNNYYASHSNISSFPNQNVNKYQGLYEVPPAYTHGNRFENVPDISKNTQQNTESASFNKYDKIQGEESTTQNQLQIEPIVTDRIEVTEGYQSPRPEATLVQVSNSKIEDKSNDTDLRIPLDFIVRKNSKSQLDANPNKDALVVKRKNLRNKDQSNIDSCIKSLDSNPNEDALVVKRKNLRNKDQSNTDSCIESLDCRNVTKTNEGLPIDNNDNNSIFSVESNYQDCVSNDLTDTRNSESDDITILETDKVPSEVKCIKTLDYQKFNLHVINYDNDYYFLLNELSKKIFGTSLRLTQIRRLIVGTPHIISVVDIRLKTNPELLKELLLYKLISEDELTVDAIPIKYLKNLTQIIPISISDINLDEILREIDFLL